MLASRPATCSHAGTSRPTQSLGILRFHRRRSPQPQRSFGKDAVDGFLDVASLVSSGGAKTNSAYADLAYAIGRDVYADLSGWHLYMRDLSLAPGVKANDVLANLLGSRAGSSGLREKEVEAVLKSVPVKLGGGKLKVALFEVVPAVGVRDLTRVVEDFARSK